MFQHSGERNRLYLHTEKLAEMDRIVGTRFKSGRVFTNDANLRADETLSCHARTSPWFDRRKHLRITYRCKQMAVGNPLLGKRVTCQIYATQAV